MTKLSVLLRINTRTEIPMTEKQMKAGIKHQSKVYKLVTVGSKGESEFSLIND